MSEMPIYLDYNATTPIAPDVFEVMVPWMTSDFGNASSTHLYGQRAADAVRVARNQVADSLGVRPNSIVFTSGATEANNLAIRGVSGRIVVPATEHKAVLDTARSRDYLLAPVGEDGRVDLSTLEEMAAGSGLISVMLANNETGVIQDLGSVVEIARRHGCLVHTDMTQALGKLDVNLSDLGVDLASCSAHKIYGPKGIGALYVRRGLSLESVMTGGGHERGIRSGTLNVPGIVGFGAAAARLNPSERSRASRVLLDQLLTGLAGVSPSTLYSDHLHGLPNTLNIGFDGADAEAVIANSPEICISTGSACTASIPEPSHVLMAMGVSSDSAFESLRISVGEMTTAYEIEQAAQSITRAVQRIRGFQPNRTMETSQL